MNKYLKTGAINPAWAEKEDARIMSEGIKESINELLDAINLNMDIELAKGVNINISNSRQSNQQIEMCSIVTPLNDYESKFEFIKRHSSSPEDLKLAREIVGLY